MTQITMVVRGSEVEFEAVFSSTASPNAQADSATLRINFPISTIKRMSVELDLVKSQDNKWRAVWDTSDALRGGVVDWSVQSQGGIVAASEGTFLLEANRANREDEI